jgi:hypothetical protein
MDTPLCHTPIYIKKYIKKFGNEAIMLYLCIMKRIIDLRERETGVMVCKVEVDPSRLSVIDGIRALFVSLANEYGYMIHEYESDFRV